jgi:hypothetical protein
LPGYYFEELTGVKLSSQTQSPRTADSDPLNRRETLELVRAYYQIPDPKQHHEIVLLNRSLGK